MTPPTTGVCVRRAPEAQVRSARRGCSGPWSLLRTPRSSLRRPTALPDSPPAGAALHLACRAGRRGLPVPAHHRFDVLRRFREERHVAGGYVPCDQRPAGEREVLLAGHREERERLGDSVRRPKLHHARPGAGNRQPYGPRAPVAGEQGQRTVLLEPAVSGRDEVLVRDRCGFPFRLLQERRFLDHGHREGVQAAPHEHQILLARPRRECWGWGPFSETRSFNVLITGVADRSG